MISRNYYSSYLQSKKQYESLKRGGAPTSLLIDHCDVVIHNDEKIIQLIKDGADVNFQDEHGKTALMHYYEGSYDCYFKVLKHFAEADVNIEDKNHRNVLWYFFNNIYEKMDFSFFPGELIDDLQYRESLDFFKEKQIHVSQETLELIKKIANTEFHYTYLQDEEYDEEYTEPDKDIYSCGGFDETIEKKTIEWRQGDDFSSDDLKRKAMYYKDLCISMYEYTQDIPEKFTFYPTDDCPMCTEKIKDRWIGLCGHTICEVCFEKLPGFFPKCPLCRQIFW